MFSTALLTPRPSHFFLSSSRSSTASCSPVDAPEGTAARPSVPSSRITSTSTVGLPRESRIWRPRTNSMQRPMLASSSYRTKWRERSRNVGGQSMRAGTRVNSQENDRLCDLLYEFGPPRYDVSNMPRTPPEAIGRLVAAPELRELARTLEDARAVTASGLWG